MGNYYTDTSLAKYSKQSFKSMPWDHYHKRVENIN